MFTTSGSVLGSLLFARKLVIVPEGILYQSSWRTPWRLFSLSVYLIMVEYLVNSKRIKNVLFRSNAHKKNSGNFSCAHHFFCSHQGWTLYLARSKVNIKISFLMHNIGASMSKQWERVKFATWRSFKRMFLWIVWCSVWWTRTRTTIFFEELSMWMEQKTFTFLTYCRYHQLTQA